MERRRSGVRRQPRLDRVGDLRQILRVARREIAVEAGAQAEAEGQRHGEFRNEGRQDDDRKKLVKQLQAHATPSILRIARATARLVMPDDLAHSPPKWALVWR
jgi:hypothetical protein